MVQDRPLKELNRHDRQYWDRLQRKLNHYKDDMKLNSISITIFLNQHIEELVTHFPVTYMTEDTRERTIACLIDRLFGPVLQKEPHEMEDVPFVPFIVTVSKNFCVSVRVIVKQKETYFASSKAYRTIRACNGVLPRESGALINSLHPRSSNIRRVFKVSSADFFVARITKER